MAEILGTPTKDGTSVEDPSSTSYDACPTENGTKSGTTVTAPKEARQEDTEKHGDSSTNTPLSKNQLKKLKRKQVWEERKEDRKRIRKEKRHIRAARKREERNEKVAAAQAAGLDPDEVLKAEKPGKPSYNPVPVAFILDCDFEQYMRDPEIVSLSSQVVRSYSQNRNGKYQAHLFISSFKGKMKTRFETVLSNNHKKWRGTHFVEGDFREAARQASELMAGPKGGDVIDVLRRKDTVASEESSIVTATNAALPMPEPEPDDVDRSIVYLTSESPYTLEALEPHTSYVIGGLVDRNREKGLCYRRAREMKVRTAKLPIGEYMAMQSRYVLTTNQVVEIMSKWLECGNWGESFLAVIPKRKGGTLKGQGMERQGSEALGSEADTVEIEDAHGSPADVQGEEQSSMSPKDREGSTHVQVAAAEAQHSVSE